MMRRSDLILLAVATVAACAFFASLERLWPLVDGRLLRDEAAVRVAAAPVLERLDLPVDGTVIASRLRVDEPALDYVEQTFGRARCRELLADGCPLVVHRVACRHPGIADTVTLAWHPAGRLLGWEAGVQEDAAGATLEPAEAEALARAALEPLGARELELSERATIERPARRDHRLAFTRWREREPELRERWEMVVAGDRVVKAWPTAVVPAAAQRAARAARAPIAGLQTLGWLGLGLLTVAALLITLHRLRSGEVRLRRALGVAGGALALLLLSDALQTARLVEVWDPLWPRWLAHAQDLGWRALDGAVAVLPVLAFLAAGDALDRAGGHARGATLWALARGRLADPGVAAASARGFLIGAICGATLLAVVAILVAAGGRTALQPRGFFLVPLGSALPALGTLAFFGFTAAVEELGYRFFAGTWIERLTGRRWLAVLAPAVIYGLMHTDLAFLPPAEPWWGRALALTAVGAVWGWAFFRYDALTVLLSHLTADLFIFGWPQLATGDAGQRAAILLAMAVPLLPAALWALRRLTSPSAPGVPPAT